MKIYYRLKGVSLFNTSSARVQLQLYCSEVVMNNYGRIVYNIIINLFGFVYVRIYVNQKNPFFGESKFALIRECAHLCHIVLIYYMTQYSRV